MDKPPVLVFGGGINGLGIARNLGREGVAVYLILDRPDPSLYSKYCKKAFIVPDFTRRPHAVQSFLSKFRGLFSSNRPVVLSTNDRTTLILSGLKDRLENYYNFVIPDTQAAETLIIKRKFYESLVRNKIEHPRVIVPRTRSDLTRAGNEFGYPVFVRPCLSQSFSDVFFGKKGFLAGSEAQLVNHYEKVTNAGLDVILQELVPGPTSNVFGIAGYFGSGARPLALFGYHRLRGWPTIIGNNTLIESVPLCSLQSARETVVKYLSDLGYHGIMESEFKLDPRDGVYKLLEINARSWWQNSFPTKCGLNIVHRAYLDTIGHSLSYNENYVTRVKWITLLEDLIASLATKEMFTSSWIKSLVGVKDYAFFDPDDLSPALMNLPFDFGLLDPGQGRLRPNVIRSALAQVA